MSFYYVGDLCHVLDEGDWDKVCAQLEPIGDDDYDPEVWLDGEGLRTAIMFPTAYGDGVYTDGDGREYSVDSGTLGAILYEFTDHAKGADAVKRGLGHLIEFDELDAGECGYDEGLIAFGMMQKNGVEIDTGE